MVSVPERAPVGVGEKDTLIVQFVPVVSDFGQSSVCTKSLGSVPPMVKLVVFNGVAPGLLNVIVCDALVVPTFCAAKLRLLGCRPITGSFKSTDAEPISPSVDPFAVAKSRPPSLLKSATTMPEGIEPVVKVTPFPNVPSPLPGIIVMKPGLPAFTMVTAKSNLPSLLKSPATTE